MTKNTNTKKQKSAERKKLLETLSKALVSNVKFTQKKIFLDFFGHKISDSITIKKEEHVGEWSRKRKEIFIDRNISGEDRKKSFKALCVHEAIEKFVVEKFHLNLDNEAHIIAEKKEKEYLKKLKGNWRSHELIVYWDWHNQGEHH